MTNPRPFAVFDIDGTVIRWQLYHAIVQHLIQHQKIDPAHAEAIHQARLTWQKRSHLDSFHHYENQVTNSFHQAITQISTTDLDHAVDQVFQTYRNQVYTYTRDLIKQLKNRNYLLFAISGSQHQIVSKLGQYYNFDDVIGVQYVIENDHFTSRVERPVFNHKGPLLQELVHKHQADWKGSIAIGDTSGDIAMLQLVENPVAFNPDDQLYRAAKESGWPIVAERKNVIFQLKPSPTGHTLSEDPVIELGMN